MWRLLPFKEVEQFVEVLTYGAEKYEVDNWKKVSEERYVDALFRHLNAWMQGEQIDKESGIHHLAHAGTNILFLMWFENQRKISEENKNLQEMRLEEKWPSQ